MITGNTVHVAVGVIFNAAGEVLISRRHPDSHQGGLWEFPGGKVEPGETLLQALDREFYEELGVRVHKAFPLRRIAHRYEDKAVLLDTWQITEYSGIARGLEGQDVRWQALPALSEKDFPAANAAIIRTLQMAPLLAITPPVDSLAALEKLIAAYLRSGRRLIQLRQKQLDSETYGQWYERAAQLCGQGNATLLFNGAIESLDKTGVQGFHSTAYGLMRLKQRPVADTMLYSAACHNLAELQQAEKLNADLVLLSPVLPTPKYQDERVLGWQEFESLASQVSLPVYALGGLRPADLATARAHGGFGIAGISGFLEP